MSGVVDVLVLPPLYATIVAGGPAFGALLGAGMAGYAAYAMLDKLRKDYDQSLREFRTRSAEDEQQRQQLADGQMTSTNMALLLAEHTESHVTENATMTFLREHAQELAQRIAEMPAPNAELLEQCQALLENLSASPRELMKHFDAYDRLFESFTAEAKDGADTATIKSATASALAILREEIASPLLAAPECRETRETLLSQLDTVETLATGRQAAVAGQALTLLRQRINRELREQAERLQARASERQAMRELVSEMLAKLQAIAGLAMLPEFTQHAETLLGQLRAELAQPSADSLAALGQLGQQVDTLFSASEKALQGELISSYVSSNVSEVLLSLGYRVAQITPDADADPHACVAAFDEATGVQFNVDATGRLTTEMVALDANAAQVDRSKQEKVCSMIDQVLDALKQRDWQLRERYRSNFADQEQLRVAELPTLETHRDETTAPKMQRIDE